jgi:uroporphyrinogen decarboxylase
MQTLTRNTLILDALKCNNHSGRPPVWLMRQAGRYMPEYRAMRKKHDFLTMCHTPELAAEVTLMPIKCFEFDAAILFSDILVIPEALDVGLRFDEGLGPIIERPLSSARDILALPKIHSPDKLSYVADAIKLIKQDLQIPLLGFAGAPFTLASYMIEGRSSKSWSKTKQWMFDDPQSFHQLLDTLAEYTIDYLKMQIEAGVDAIQLFDSWAHVLNHDYFREFSLKYMQKILDGLRDTQIPTILYCRGSSVFAPTMVEATPSAISVDWNADISAIRKVIPKNIALQGNLDPDILLASKETVSREVRKILTKMSGEPGFIFNLGHGITPKVNPDNVKTLVETIRQHT